MKLTVELVPKTCWYSNVRSNVSTAEWDRIRKQVYQKANHVCEICGGVGKRHPVECHEVWAYDDEKHIQKLVRMTALCPACHSVKHLGRALAVGIFEDALGQLMRVNGIGYLEARQYTQEVFAKWKERSQHKWKLNIDHLVEYSPKNGKDEDSW